MDEFSDLTKNELRFEELLYEENPLDHMYVYWLQDGEKITPAIVKNVTPFSDLEMFLQQKYGCQSYCVIIRREKKMILKHEFHIAQPLNFIPEADIRKEIEKLQRQEQGESAPTNF